MNQATNPQKNRARENTFFAKVKRLRGTDLYVTIARDAANEPIKPVSRLSSRDSNQHIGETVAARPTRRATEKASKKAATAAAQILEHRSANARANANAKAAIDRAVRHLNTKINEIAEI